MAGNVITRSRHVAAFRCANSAAQGPLSAQPSEMELAISSGLRTQYGAVVEHSSLIVLAAAWDSAGVYHWWADKLAWRYSVAQRIWQSF